MYSQVIDFIRQTFHQPDGIVPLHAPCFVGNEKKYLDECIDSTYVSSVGKFVDRFEEMALNGLLYVSTGRMLCIWRCCWQV